MKGIFHKRTQCGEGKASAKDVDIVEVQYTKQNKIVLNFVVGLIFQILQRWNRDDKWENLFLTSFLLSYDI